MSYLFSSSPSSCDYRTRSTIMSSVDPERDYQPSSPLNSNEPVTFHHSPNSQTEYSSDDGAYRVASPSTSEGNQQGYYNKYGKWPAVPNGTDVLLQKVLGTLDPEQGTEITYSECGTQNTHGRARKRQRCTSCSDDESNKEDFPARKAKQRQREHEAVGLLRSTISLSQQAVRLSQRAIELLAEMD